MIELRLTDILQEKSCTNFKYNKNMNTSYIYNSRNFIQESQKKIANTFLGMQNEHSRVKGKHASYIALGRHVM